MRLVISVGLCSLLLLAGCASKEPQTIYKTEYVKVDVPVSYPIERPNRPVKDKGESTPSYLAKVLNYTETLEMLIDEHNKEVNSCVIKEQK